MTQKKRRSIVWFAIPLTVIGVAAVTASVKVAGITPDAPATNPNVDPDYLRDLTTEAMGKRAVLASLKDPSSAQFGDSFGRLKHGKRVACGYVNARNGFGGYAGSTPWVMVVEDNVLLFRGGDGGRFARTWNRYCTGDPDK